MSNRRENNYDLLRCISILAVIALHITAQYSGYRAQYEIPLVVWSKITCFCVPCFIMLSGAFVLDNQENCHYSSFYRKSFKKLGAHVGIFSVLYVVYRYLKMFFITTYSVSGMFLVNPIISFLKGTPYYHLWYMYMLIGLYVVTPVLIKLRQDIGFKNFELMAWALIVLCSITDVTSTYDTSWGITSFKWLGYYMIGYIIRTRAKYSHHFNAVLFTVIGWGGMFLIAVLSIIRNNYQLKIPLWELGSAMHPLTILSSICIVIAFSKYKVDVNLSKIASKIFYIYLLHAGVIEFVKIIFEKYFGCLPNPIWFIPVATLITLAISYMLSLIYEYVYNRSVDAIINSLEN